MAQTRTIYDDCYYREKLEQSNHGINYMLYRGQTDTAVDCYPYSSLLPKQDRNPLKFADNTEAGVLTDIESHLGTRGDNYSKCIPGRTNMDRNKKLYSLSYGHEQQFKQSVQACKNRFLEMHDTSLYLPKNDIKDLDVFDYRYQELHKNPQCTIFWDGGLNTRNFSRDTYIEPKTEIIIDEDNVTKIGNKKERFVMPGVYDSLGQTGLPREFYTKK